MEDDWPHERESRLCSQQVHSTARHVNGHLAPSWPALDHKTMNELSDTAGDGEEPSQLSLAHISTPQNDLWIKRS